MSSDSALKTLSVEYEHIRTSPLSTCQSHDSQNDSDTSSLNNVQLTPLVPLASDNSKPYSVKEKTLLDAAEVIKRHSH